MSEKNNKAEKKDVFIADLSGVIYTQPMNTGWLSRSERIARYNCLLEIEFEPADRGSAAGTRVFARYIA